MTISVQIIADSINEQGNRITSVQLRYPRFIHAELMTHRKFSRNASSSRAIPVKRIIADIMEDPAVPMHWGKNQPGMQAHEELFDKVPVPTDTGGERDATKEEAWLLARDRVVAIAQGFDHAGYHKQIVNRLLEPWSHINVLVTATEWQNFFHLRSHEDAQPEIRILSDMIQVEMNKLKPVLLKAGEWHLPYVDRENDYLAAYDHLKKGRVTRDEPSLEEIERLLCKVSAARCARVSYMLHSGKKSTLEEDLTLYQRLLGSQPLHASPAEHQATPDMLITETWGVQAWANKALHGNFTGWNQFRKMLPGEFYPG
uniref:Thymidylate synthase n=1 Tax=Erwinia phage Fifi051 TaxID=3238787 RepID=A0AB39ACJ1_9CAUD